MKKDIRASKALLLRAYLTQIITFCFIIFLFFVIFYNGTRDEKYRINTQNERYLDLIVARLDFVLSHLRHVSKGQTDIKALIENKNYIEAVYEIDTNSNIIYSQNEIMFLTKNLNYNKILKCISNGGYCVEKFPYNIQKPNNAFLGIAVPKGKNIVIAFINIQKMASTLLTDKALAFDKDGYFINDASSGNIYDVLDLPVEFNAHSMGLGFNNIEKKWQFYSINYIPKIGIGLLTSKNCTDILMQHISTLLLLVSVGILILIISMDLITFIKKGILAPIKELRMLLLDLSKDKIHSYDFKNNKEFLHIHRNIMKLFFKLKYINSKLYLYEIQNNIILENSPLILLFVDAKTSRIIACSKAALDFYGYSKKDLLTKAFYELNYEKNEPFHLSNLSEIGNQISKFAIHATAKGEKKTIQLTIKAVDGGMNSFYLINISDVSKVADLYYMTQNAKGLAQNSPMVILCVDKKYKITQSTDNISSIIKYNKDTLINENMNLSDLILKKEKLDDIKNFISTQERIGTDNTFDDFMQIKLGNGIILWFRVCVKLNYQSKSIYANIFMMDISSIYEQLLSARRLLERYDQQLQGSSLITWEYDIINKTYNFSNTFFKLIGYKEAINDMSLLVLSKFIPQNYLNMLIQEQEKCIQDTKYHFTLTLRLNSRYKKETWIELKGYYALFEVEDTSQNGSSNKKCPMIIGILEDISEEMQTDARLNLLAQIFTHSREGITITDADQNILETNKAFEAITGYTSGEVAGKKPSILQSGLHDNEFYDKMWHDINEEGYWRGEIINRRKNGEECPEILSISAVRDKAGDLTNYIGIFSDITELKAKEKQLREIAYFDGLTGLPNKTYFIEEIQKRMQKANSENTSIAILYMDLDGFKKANDTYGHHCGDEVLIEVGKRLKAQIKSTDIVSRLGGDEFVAIVNDSGNELKAILNNILVAINENFIIGEYTVKIGTTIGVAFYPQQNKINHNELLEQADWAMYQAKLAGKNRYYIFDETSSVIFKEYKNILAKLDKYDPDNFEIMFVPYYNAQKNEIAGLEAYVRLKGALNILSANDFSNILSQKYWFSDLNIWLIKTALEEFKKLNLKNASLNVNMPISQLTSAAFFKKISDLAMNFDLSGLKLKVVDLFASRDVVEEALGLKRYLSLGIGLIFDDLGENDANSIEKISHGEFKLQKSYAENLLNNYANIEHLEYILKFCQENQKSVGATNVSNPYAYKILSTIGYKLMSGEFICEPVSADELDGAIKSLNRRKTELRKLAFMDMPNKQSALNFYKFIIFVTSSIDDLCKLFQTRDTKCFNPKNYALKFNQLKDLQDSSLLWACDEADKQIRYIAKHPNEADELLENLKHEKLNLLNSIIGE